MHHARLYVRKRPTSADVVQRRGQRIIVHDPRPRRRPTELALPASATWWEGDISNAAIWDKTFQPAVAAACDGETPGMLWLAYGQTGSGKTHTLTGTGRDLGLLQRTVLWLLQDGSSSSSSGGSGTAAAVVRFQAAQLHCERATCLRTGAPVCLGQLLRRPGQPLRNAADLQRALAAAARRRRVGCTALNRRSSRSHTVYLLEVAPGTGGGENGEEEEGGDDPDKTVRPGTLDGSGTRRDEKTFRLVFLDLAGNEKGKFSVAASRSAMREGIAINQSLFALKECIRATHQQQGHVPFRRSKLTAFLAELLGLELPLAFIATLHPEHAHDSLDTLRYATSIASIGAPPADKTTEIDLERYSRYVMEMYELIRQDQELFQSLRRRGRRRVSLAAVLRLLEAKLGFLRRHRRVLPCG